MERLTWKRGHGRGHAGSPVATHLSFRNASTSPPNESSPERSSLNTFPCIQGDGYRLAIMAMTVIRACVESPSSTFHG